MDQDQKPEIGQAQRPHSQGDIDEAAQRIGDAAEGEHADVSENGFENGALAGHAGLTDHKASKLSMLRGHAAG
ncbi:hypothetical protein GCM10007872_12170 [Gluconobacter sphaericus NBRC 12467]|uniref:Uncharacterized protein n=1 Tax=Gluconobacter sphaericus NBRC 12467 TaxID=1307951 RepID=A0AA37WBG3_9PROT|nr:hypothetical protein GSP01_05170 [Gluconobacter sphaericus NBRC 12467]GLQ84309.1 hypothetical protein GCM10007872_12170 [Gluconobacter sphaericus NBRC 12467]